MFKLYHSPSSNELTFVEFFSFDICGEPLIDTAQVVSSHQPLLRLFVLIYGQVSELMNVNAIVLLAATVNCKQVSVLRVMVVCG